MPINIRIGRLELPVGLALVFLVLLAAALANLMTKTVATVSGMAFAAAFLIAFAATERIASGRSAETTEANGRATSTSSNSRSRSRSD